MRRSLYNLILIVAGTLSCGREIPPAADASTLLVPTIPPTGPGADRCSGINGAEALDPGFGGCGRISVGRDNLRATDAAIDSGKIIVGGYYIDGEYRASAATITTSGISAGPTLASSSAATGVAAVRPNAFSGFDVFVGHRDGIEVLRSGASPDDETLSAHGFAPLANFAMTGAISFRDGSVLIAGGTDGTVEFLKLTAAGELDPSFGDAGRVSAEYGSDTGATSVAVAALSEGDFVSLDFIGGDRQLARRSASGLERWRATLTDSSFAPRVFVDLEDRATLLGETGGVVSVIRLLPTGEPDTTFGPGGRVVLSSLEPLEVRDAAVASNGAIFLLALGSSWGRATVVRLTPDGEVDSAFGVDGVVTVEHNGTPEPIRILLDTKDRPYIVASGVHDSFVERLRD